MPLPTPYYQSDRATLYHGDCLKMRPELTANAVVSDVPYGMDWDTDSTRFTGGAQDVRRGEGREDWGDIQSDAEPFNPEPWLSFPKVVLWGANHYAARLPVGTMLVWVKKADHLFGTFLSDAEIAWMKGGYGVYCHRKQFPPPSRMAENNGEVAHPCQKPIGLMAWCLDRASIPADGAVLDPYMGSGTTGVACIQTGRRFIGIEIEERYCEIAARRIREAEEVGAMFRTPKAEQAEMFA